MAAGLVDCGRRNATRIALRVLNALLSNWTVMDMGQGLTGWTEEN